MAFDFEISDASNGGFGAFQLRFKELIKHFILKYLL